MNNAICPICSGKAQRDINLLSNSSTAFDCEACGRFYIVNFDLGIDKDKFASFLFYHKAKYADDRDHYYFIGDKALYQSKKAIRPNLTHLVETEVNDWYPESFDEKISNILLAFDELSHYEGQSIKLNPSEKMSMFFIKRKANNGEDSSNIDRVRQYQYYADHMKKENLLEDFGEGFVIQPNGFKRINFLRSEKQKISTLTVSTENALVTTSLKVKVEELISRGEEIKIKEYHGPNSRVGMIPHVAGPMFDAWMSEINIFNERNLKSHPLYHSIYTTYFHKKRSACDDMLGHLRALASDSDYWDRVDSIPNTKRYKAEGERDNKMNNKVFIVHGHDNAAEESMARTLEKGGLDAIILHEKPSGGKTIIEKIEANTDVCFAVVLYTPCDLGHAKEDSKENLRARQNVVFEHGYLIAKLGRDRVCALVKGEIETPGDISGVVYIPLDAHGAWKMKLAKEMINVGLPIDMNKFLF